MNLENTWNAHTDQKIGDSVEKRSTFVSPICNKHCKINKLINKLQKKNKTTVSIRLTLVKRVQCECVKFFYTWITPISKMHTVSQRCRCVPSAHCLRENHICTAAAQSLAKTYQNDDEYFHCGTFPESQLTQLRTRDSSAISTFLTNIRSALLTYYFILRHTHKQGVVISKVSNIEGCAVVGK